MTFFPQVQTARDTINEVEKKLTCPQCSWEHRGLRISQCLSPFAGMLQLGMDVMEGGAGDVFLADLR